MIAQTSNENGVQTDGFAIVEDVLSREKVDALLHALERIGDTGSVRKRSGIFAVRNLLDVSAEVRERADSDAVRVLVEPVLGTHFFPVRGILFDKIPDANWKVPWHQDVTIAVRERVEVDGFGPWSMKADVQRSWSTCSRCVCISIPAVRRTALCVLCLDRTLAARSPRRGFRLSARVYQRRSARSALVERC
jgi:hypothetical protein